MKNISTIVKKGNLTAKERALIFISTQIEQDKTGKNILDAKLMEAIKDEKAFVNDRYIDTYNNYVKVWTQVVFINLDAKIENAKSKLMLQILKIVAFVVAKTSLLSTKLKESLEKIYESDESIKQIADVYFEIGFKYTEMLSPFSVIKQEPKNGETTVDLNDSLWSITLSNITGFKLLYGVLLAHQKVLKIVSKELGLDVAYKVDKWVKELSKDAKKYNDLLEIGLVDCRTGKYSLDEKLQIKDKAFSDRKMYLDLSDISYDKETFIESMKIFEELLGNKFWENN